MEIIDNTDIDNTVMETNRVSGCTNYFVLDNKYLRKDSKATTLYERNSTSEKAKTGTSSLSKSVKRKKTNLNDKNENFKNNYKESVMGESIDFDGIRELCDVTYLAVWIEIKH